MGNGGAINSIGGNGARATRCSAKNGATVTPILAASPRLRALRLKQEKELYWSDPYSFSTTQEPGMTASTHWP